MIENSKEGISVELMNSALGKNIVTNEIIDLCKNIYSKSNVYNLPWSTKGKDAIQFAKDNGSVSFSSVKVPGVYIIHMPHTKDTYVGQSINIGVRIRAHLQMASISTKYVLDTLKASKEGSVQTCIIDKSTLDIIDNIHNITLADFLDILEQYLILLVQPTLNKMFLVRHGGVTSPYSNRILKHPNRLPLYVYKVQSKSSIEKVLIYKFPTVGSLGKLLNLNPDFGRSILKGNGLFRDMIYLTTITPTDVNDNKHLITETEFVQFFKKALDKSYPSASKPVYLINAVTNEKTGPYPSITHVCNHVLIGASRKYLKTDRLKPYHGFFVEYVPTLK